MSYDPTREPVNQGDPEVVTTRQRGIDPESFAAVDPTPPPPVIQGSSEIFTTRQGSSVQHFDASGTLIADHVADDGHITYSDAGPARGDANPPPPADLPLMTDIPLPGPQTFDVVPADAGAPPAVPPLVGVLQADQPGDSGDPRHDASVGPQTITVEQIAAAKAAKKAGKK